MASKLNELKIYEKANNIAFQTNRLKTNQMINNKAKTVINFPKSLNITST